MTIASVFASSIMGCFQQGSFSAAFNCLGNTDIGTFLIPFLLVFAIIYGILGSDKVKVVSGKAATLIALALSLLVAFQVQSLNLLAGLMKGISAPFLVVIVGIVLAWIIWGLIKDEAPEGDVEGINYTTIIFFVIVAVVIFFFGARVLGGGAGRGLASGTGFLSGNWTVIIIGLLLIIIIAWVLSKGGGGGGGEGSNE